MNPSNNVYVDEWQDVMDTIALLAHSIHERDWDEINLWREDIYHHETDELIQADCLHIRMVWKNFTEEGYPYELVAPIFRSVESD